MSKTKSNVGRKPINPAKKVKMMVAYLRLEEQTAIKKKYGNLTKATRAAVLPQCG